MTLKEFILKTKDMVTDEDIKTLVLDWVEFACDMSEACETGLEDELEDIYFPLAYVKNNFSPDILRESLRMLVVSNEIIPAAMYMEAGCAPEQVRGLAASGRFEDGDRMHADKQIGAFTLVQVDGQAGGCFLAENEPLDLIAHAVRRACRLARESGKRVEDILCDRRISDLRIKAIGDTEKQAVLVHNFQHNTAIGNYLMYWPADDRLEAMSCPALEQTVGEDEQETESPEECDCYPEGLQ